MDIKALKKIISYLQQDIPLSPKHQDHTLSGNWSGFRECHIKPDWLLIYKKKNSENGRGVLQLEATGSHADLF